jgi:dienelactone hydrolase
MKQLLPLACLVTTMAAGEIRTHPGGKILPHEQYRRVVSLTDSPAEQLYIKTKDGLYVAAALRKPAGPGPFPALLYFHGAPGGRGMERLLTWSRGETGGPLWERFLKEGFVVVVADYRHPVGHELRDPFPLEQANYADDAQAVYEHVQKLAYVDPARISAYGVSLGGPVSLYLSTRVKLASLVLGAPAPQAFLARPNLVTQVGCPVQILVGTNDGLLDVDRALHEALTAAGKPVEMDIYENGYHDFVAGPQGHEGRDEPLMDITLDALERALAFVRGSWK